MTKCTGLRSFLLAGLFLGSGISFAYEFEPTDAEWSGWPGYCKAKYVWTQIGQVSRFVNDVSDTDLAELATWETGGAHGIHHWCAGIVWMQRAKRAPDTEALEFMLSMAEGELQFTLSGTDPASPYYVTLVVPMISLLQDQDRTDEALDRMKRVIAAQPDNDVAYSATAVMQRKLGHLDEARETLLQGDERTGRESAEIAYNLGLVYLELGDEKNAILYAQRAYSMGFPLPGLRFKLERKGLM